jgi:DNA (cytosine-5)-methyltransferase 1
LNHREKLLEVYSKEYEIELPDEVILYLKNIGENSKKSKAVFTVLITLATHKILFPKQDIRYHQKQMANGFSGRSIDTKQITPTLKEIGLPSMNETGWLTRSLEQPYPYNLNYEGKISGKGRKEAFLKAVDFLQNNPIKAEEILKVLLNLGEEVAKSSRVEITPLENIEISIFSVTSLLEQHFMTNYGTHGGAKLPVIAFHSIYKILIDELFRYKDCELKPLGSHTASDRTSKSAGDIEIFRDGKLFEAIEIKLDKEIDITILRNSYEKIKLYNPSRYYILSYHGIKESDKREIEELIREISTEHGCQVIVNGLIYTLKYYLRLINTPKNFLELYSKNIATDLELQKVHKDKLNSLIEELNSL